jgi:hypothetical protein
MNERWLDQKAGLESKLKRIFECNSSDLLWGRCTPRIETLEGTSPESASLSTLETIHFQMLDLFPDFPHSTSFVALTRASIYFLGLVCC